MTGDGRHFVDYLERQDAPDVLGPHVVLGRVANTITKPADDLYVTVPSFDGNRQRWGPCDWTPANALPTRGDDCMVCFVEDETPYVVLFTWGSRSVAGLVAAPGPSVPTDPLYVTIDGGKVGPIAWSPRDHIPNVGDTVLVQFDQAGTPWATTFGLPPPDIEPPSYTPELKLLWDYTVAGAAKATIDNVTDGPGAFPATYGTLLLDLFCQSSQAASDDTDIRMRLNNDSGNNYDGFVTRGSDPSGGGTTWLTRFNPASPGTDHLFVGDAVAQNYVNRWTTTHIRIQNYANTGATRFANISVDGVHSKGVNPGPYQVLRTVGGGVYHAAAAITRFQLYLLAGNFAIGTRLRVWGQ